MATDAKEEKKFSQEQYDMLIRCSDKKDMTEWNQRRKENPGEEIWLQGAPLNGLHLGNTILLEAHLEGAQLHGTHLEGAILNEDAHLEKANLERAHLEGAQLVGTHLEGAHLLYAHLESANLMGAHLEKADFVAAHLEGADFRMTHLQQAKFNCVLVNSETSFIGCRIDEDTDFRDTALENMRIKSGTKTRLKYNIRRMNWKDWYKEHRALQWLVKWFWSMSNYGISTKRIIAWFLGLAFAFACVYSLCPCYVMVNGEVGDIRGFVHALYFSVVTMTTLGFGDIAANPDSWSGQVLLMFQVIFGYVLLGALVTRLAVLFTSDGPAGSFTPMSEKKVSGTISTISKGGDDSVLDGERQ